MFERRALKSSCPGDPSTTNNRDKRRNENHSFPAICSRDRLFCKGVKRVPLISRAYCWEGHARTPALFTGNIFASHAREQPLARTAGGRDAV